MAILVMYSAVSGRITVGNKQYREGERLVCPKDGELDVLLLPRYSEPTYLTLYLTLRFRDGRLLPSDGYRAVMYGEYIELTLTPPLFRPARAPRVISQETLGSTLATLYDDGELRLMCEGERFLTRTLPPLTNPRLYLRETNKGNTVIVRGETEGSKYLLLVTVSDGRTVYEITAPALSVTEECVVATEHIRDMMGHMVTTTYRPGTPPDIDVRATRSPTLTDVLMPYAFLEALRVEARDEAMRYLAIDTDYDSVREYFGTFDTVRPLPEGFKADLVTVYDSSNAIVVPTVYRFELTDGRITNVDRLEGYYPPVSI